MSEVKEVVLPENFEGWISRKHGVIWVVSPYRTDKRTGVIKDEQ